ncbi:hypothetical protein N9I05_01485 [Pseudomonadales bacterium]|nr:hypothetical protein [Pseudomonadales bacterium]
MFRDYKELNGKYYTEEGHANDPKSLPYQANRYYSLVRHIEHQATNVNYNLKELYELVKSNLFEKFNSSTKNGSVNGELLVLINLSDNDREYYSYSNYSTSYEANRMYSKSMKYKDEYEPLWDIRDNIGNHLANTMSEIVKKEIYLDYKLNETEADIVRNEYKDKVLGLNRKVSQISSNHLFNLTYSFVTKDEDDEAKFIKDVRSITPMRYNPTIKVNKHWFDTVGDLGFQMLEYQGSRAFTISAEEYSRDNNRTLYFVKTLQMTGTREEMREANWYHKGEAVDKLIKIKDLVLSVSNQDDKIWALGADESWAERTMRARQKRTMMAGLNI